MADYDDFDYNTTYRSWHSPSNMDRWAINTSSKYYGLFCGILKQTGYTTFQKKNPLLFYAIIKQTTRREPLIYCYLTSKYYNIKDI
jgi:hypothetical protein